MSDEAKLLGSHCQADAFHVLLDRRNTSEAFDDQQILWEEMILKIAMRVSDMTLVLVALHLVRCEQVELYWPARYFTSFDQRIALAMQERITYDQFPEIIRCHHLSWRAVDQLVHWVISSDLSLAAIDPMQVQINRCQAAGDQAHAAVNGRERHGSFL